MNVLIIFQLSTKTTCLGKIWLLSYDPKTCKPIGMQDCLNYSILQTISYIQSFQVGVVRYAQNDSKQRVSYVSKMNSGTKLVFGCG